MALPSYESVGPVVASSRPLSRVARVVCGSAVMLLAAALVAFAGQATEQAPLSELLKKYIND